MILLKKMQKTGKIQNKGITFFAESYTLTQNYRHEYQAVKTNKRVQCLIENVNINSYIMLIEV